MCQSQPAMAHSPAGNAHVPMTDEEKLCQRNRLSARRCRLGSLHRKLQGHLRWRLALAREP